MKSSMMRAGTASKQRWMIVDDNPQFLAFLQQAAGLYTDRVIECYDGPQAALAAFEANPGAFEFVVTDLEMPGMDGLEFCRRLRERTPALKVLLVTGNQQLKSDDLALTGFCGRLQKPFTPADLATTLSFIGVGNVNLMLSKILGS